MMTIIEVLDTAIKVGLGATISAAGAWILSRQSYIQRANEKRKENLREIVKEFSLLSEEVAKEIDLVAHSFFQGDVDIARDSSISAIKHCRSAKALANIIANSNILSILEVIGKTTMDIYHELRVENPAQSKLTEYEKTIMNAIEGLQPEIAKSFENT